MTTLQEPRQAPRPVRPRADTEALIREARRLRRRRYLRIGGCLVALPAAIGVGVWASRGGGAGHRGPDAVSRPKAPHASGPSAAPKPPGLQLPMSGLFTQISVAPSGLLLSGETRATAERRKPTCVAAGVDPTSLEIGRLVQGDCGNPALFGHGVEAVVSQISKANAGTVSIDIENPSTGHVNAGPVVMTYEYSSDTSPVIVYGDQWLWIYDVATTEGPELLQVSIQSGEVVDSVQMPKLYRPLLAADDNGVWVANSLSGSPTTALTYVSAGSTRPNTVIADPNLPICWLTAAGTAAWLGAGTPNGGCTTDTIERFSDGSQTPLFSTAGGYVSFTVIGGEANGLWTMQWLPSDPSKEEVIHIDPDTGSESVVATLPSVPLPNYETDEGLTAGQAVYFDGSLFLLEPPYRVNGYLGYSSIVRVTPPSGT
jgi:hypothetical protein